jgi:hypothetical protein
LIFKPVQVSQDPLSLFPFDFVAQFQRGYAILVPCNSWCHGKIGFVENQNGVSLKRCNAIQDRSVGGFLPKKMMRVARIEGARKAHSPEPAASRKLKRKKKTYKPSKISTTCAPSLLASLPILSNKPRKEAILSREDRHNLNRCEPESKKIVRQFSACRRHAKQRLTMRMKQHSLFTVGYGIISM